MYVRACVCVCVRGGRGHLLEINILKEKEGQQKCQLAWPVCVWKPVEGVRLGRVWVCLVVGGG